MMHPITTSNLINLTRAEEILRESQEECLHIEMGNTEEKIAEDQLPVLASRALSVAAVSAAIPRSLWIWWIKT
jgi:hypothetical protein